jgi:hypothetical protein
MKIFGIEWSLTLNERKSRMSQIRGIMGEAVVVYCEPLITKKMGCYRLSWKVNKMGFFINLYLTYRRVMKMHLNPLKCIINQTHKILFHFVYDHLEFEIYILPNKKSKTRKNWKVKWCFKGILWFYSLITGLIKAVIFWRDKRFIKSRWNLEKTTHWNRSGLCTHH